MAEPPSGAVTFVFTDIEGSTRLVKQLRERWGDVLADHQRLLREAFGNHRGYEVDTQGDSFFVAFASARDAVLAAVEGQLAILSHRWPDGVQLKVRMGIHTGQAVVSDGRYIGLAVHRAARIGAAGHGGQVLVSQATQTLLEDEEEDLHVFLRDLGEKRLKDLDRPVRLYQVAAEGLPELFPPLRHEAQLAQAAEAALAAPSLWRRRSTLLAVAALAAAVAIAVPVVLLTSGAAAITVRPNSVGVIDPASNRVVDQIPVGARPGDITYGHGALWVANQDDKTVSRVDPKTRRQLSTIPLGATPTRIRSGSDSIWVTTDEGIKLIDPAFNQLTRTIKIHAPRRTATSPFTTAAMDVAFTRGATWVINGEGGGHVLRIDPETGRTVDTITTGNNPAALAPNATDLWVADVLDNSVSRVDPTGAITATIPVGRNPHAIAVGYGAVWVADSDDDVKRIDLSTTAVVTTIPVGRNPVAIAVGAGGVWVANQDDGTVSRIDPRSNTVVKTIRIGGSPGGITVAAGSVWVSAQAQPLTANVALAKAGGVARIDLQQPDAIDPADERTFSQPAGEWEYATCAKLLNYPDRPAPAGSRLRPEVARALPTVSPDRKTYSFTTRDGYRFSPPSNQPVTAATFKYTIERSLSPHMHSSVAANYVHDISGEADYRAGKAQHIAGVIAHGNRLTIKLTKPAGDFLTRISMPFFCAVPTNTPFRRTDIPPIPSAGPYYIASFTPGAQIVLKRNPNYTGPRPRSLKEIVYTGGFSGSQSIARIVSGRTDYVTGAGAPVDPHLASSLQLHYGPGSRAARAGHQQLFIDPLLITDMLTLNTSRPLFSNARLRRAVNYAIDRRALARQGGFFTGPGPLNATPTDQYLAPGIPGFSDQSIYPLRGDLAKARQLAGSRQRTAVVYTCNFAPCPQEAQIIKKNLAAIGMTVEIKTLPIFDVINRETKRGEPVDIGLYTWAADYPDPFDFLNLLLDSNLGPNAAQFVEPSYNRRLEAANALSGERRYRTYGRLDADLARHAAPFVAFENENLVEFFSARIGCQMYQPVYGMDLAALCIRP